MNSLEGFAETPLPNLFVIAGIAFLVLSMTDKVWTVEINKAKQRLAAILGVLFTVVGVGLHLVPVDTVSDSGVTAVQPADSKTEDMRGVERAFLQLNSYDLAVADAAARQLTKYASTPTNSRHVYTLLEHHMRQLKSPLDMHSCFDENYLDTLKCNEFLISVVKRWEEQRIEQATRIAAGFTAVQQKNLYEILLSNRALWYGRFLVADKLRELTGRTSAWTTLLGQNEFEGFREQALDELERREKALAEPVLIWALSQPHVRDDAIYLLRGGAIKSAELGAALSGVLSKLPVKSHTYKIAYEALETVYPEAREGLPSPQWSRPKAPKPPWE